MFKQYFLALLVFLQTFALFAQEHIDLRDEIVLPQTYVAVKTNAPPKIDGKQDQIWKEIPYTESFVDIEGVKSVAYQTQVKMMWDDTYLYLYAELEEPHIWGDIENRDEIIYYNNDFEVFIDPSPNTQAYGEIEVNALNTVWDLLLNKPYRVGGYANFNWNLNDLKTAVLVDGTLNDPSDIDTKWSVEMAIPLKPYIELKRDRYQNIKNGDQWRINFSRVQWDHEIIDGNYARKKENGNYLRENNWVWSPQGVINMHIPHNWGVVQFSESAMDVNAAVELEDNFTLKQALHELFEEVKWGSLKHWQNENVAVSKEIVVRYSELDSALFSFSKTSLGFELSVDALNKRYLLSQEGHLRIIDIDSEPEFRICTWAHGSAKLDYELWSAKLATYDSLGITDILIGGGVEFLKEFVPLAAEKNMQVHAWMWTLNRPNDSTAMQHPEWYAVNRNGQHSLEYRAYVDYYQWLSPFHPEAREYIKSNVRELLAVEGLASIHLDYVRYVDVILGADLQPKYGLVQEGEMPEYDYGYHPIARQQFKTLFGKDPMELDHPELSTEWRQFRLNAVTTLVNEIADEVHESNQKLSAAVFPFPEMSRQMVRQAWDDWDLDYVYPMIYHNFYRENIDWIGFATEQGLRDVDYPLYTGLYMPGFNSAEDFEKALKLAKEKGASGVSLFTVDGIKPEYSNVLIKLQSDD